MFQAVYGNYCHCTEVDFRCSIQHMATVVIVLKLILGVPYNTWQLLSLY